LQGKVHYNYSISEAHSTFNHTSTYSLQLQKGKGHEKIYKKE